MREYVVFVKQYKHNVYLIFFNLNKIFLGSRFY